MGRSYLIIPARHELQVGTENVLVRSYEQRILWPMFGKGRGSRTQRIVRFVVIAIVACLVWGVGIEPNLLVVRTVKVEAPLPHLRVALLSDLHAGAPFITMEKVRTIVDRISEQHPDLVLLLGDYVVGHGSREGGVPGSTFIPIEPIVKELARMHPPLGVFAVLGNHDEWGENANRTRAAFRSAQIPVLTNEAAQIQVNGAPLWLVGVGDVEVGKDDVQQAMKGVPVGAQAIVFSHEPDIFPSVPPWVALTVAGHTHGGQVALPFIGSPVVPSRYGQLYVHGLVSQNGHQLYVTSGIGTSILPIRLGARPEIVVIDL